MFGISGIALGAILRAYGKSKREKWQESYKDLLAVAGVYAVYILVMSFLFLLLGTTTIGAILAWLPASMTAGITTTGFGFAIVGALLAGVSAFGSLFVGALVIDVAISIKESV